MVNENLTLEQHFKNYNAWKEAAGFEEETAEDVLFGLARKGGLNGEVEELEVEVDKKNPFGIANEVADVFEFSEVLAQKYGIPIHKLPLVKGRPANTFKELQEEGKRLLHNNGHHTPTDHIHEVQRDIAELKKAHLLNGDQRVEILSRMILHTAVIMEQLGVPMERVIAAKDKRNSTKYDSQQIKLTAELFNIPVRSDKGVSAISIVRSEWDKKKDTPFLVRELGVLASARLALANPISSIKKTIYKYRQPQLASNK